jgi:exodeoxyribonuclease VII large subunit
MSQLPLFLPAVQSVSELTRYLRELLESDPALGDVWVQGEVSNFSRPASGHIYFTLKDQGAALRCVMWRTAAARLVYQPRDGDAVQVHGYVSLYEAGGQYQLYADLFRPAGEGALYQEFMRLKARLEAEGLFADERKRPLPVWPSRIGIVTSPTGAALRDMLKTISRRYPLVEVILAPTAVQGDDAPLGIVAALQALNQLAPPPDVILLARGGGSIEDLWAFNDEGVARAIIASQIPVVCGVGHETDFTIADFVADLRAPTPTAAAELATPDQFELRGSLDDLADRLGRSAQGSLVELRWTLDALANRLAQRSPLTRLLSDQQRLDELERRLGLAVNHLLEIEASHLDNFRQRLTALNPGEVLRRGYVLVTRPDGSLVAQASETKSGERLDLNFSDGKQAVEVLPRKPGDPS